MESSLPVVVTTTHNSGVVPFSILAAMLGESAFDPPARAERERHLFDQSDPFTELLFYLPGACHVQATTSRFVVDLNRRRTQGGPNGVVKETDFDSRRLYPEGFSLTPEALEERLERYWQPYHRAVTRALTRPGALFLLDGHAMTPTGPELGPDRGRRRPAFSLITGGDADGNPREPGAHTGIPAALARKVVDLLAKHFRDLVVDSEVPFEILINDPFPVGAVQDLHSDPLGPSRKPGFGLEVNRALYLRPGPDGLDCPVPGRIEALNARLQDFVRDLIPLLASVARRAPT